MPYKDKNSYKNIKCQRISQWKKRGIIFIDKLHEHMIYNLYESSTHCTLCSKKYSSTNDRHLDHNHQTGEIRNICCCSCNSTRNDCVGNTGEKYINKNFRKDRNKYYYYISIMKHRKKILSSKSTTLEKAIEIRDKFILDNPEYFL